MLRTTDYDCLKTHFIRPADDMLTHCEHKRSCPGLSDGHYHKTSAHKRLMKGNRRAVGYFNTKNLRTHALTHLTSADHEGGRKKAEHDMHALTRMTTE